MVKRFEPGKGEQLEIKAVWDDKRENNYIL
jgi:hypothetical protein